MKVFVVHVVQHVVHTVLWKTALIDNALLFVVRRLSFVVCRCRSSFVVVVVVVNRSLLGRSLLGRSSFVLCPSSC